MIVTVNNHREVRDLLCSGGWIQVGAEAVNPAHIVSFETLPDSLIRFNLLDGRNITFDPSADNFGVGDWFVHAVEVAQRATPMTPKMPSKFKYFRVEMLNIGGSGSANVRFAYFGTKAEGASSFTTPNAAYMHPALDFSQDVELVLTTAADGVTIQQHASGSLGYVDPSESPVWFEFEYNTSRKPIQMDHLLYFTGNLNIGAFRLYGSEDRAQWFLLHAVTDVNSGSYPEGDHPRDPMLVY